MMLALPNFFSTQLDQAGHVDEVLAVEMRSAGTVPHEQIVPGLCRHLCRSACGDVLLGNMVDRHSDAVSGAPIVRKLVKPRVEGRDEMAPLKDRQCLRLRIGGGYERSEDPRRGRREPDPEPMSGIAAFQPAGPLTSLFLSSEQTSLLIVDHQTDDTFMGRRRRQQRTSCCCAKSSSILPLRTCASNLKDSRLLD